jgi:hypothetical protein
MKRITADIDRKNRIIIGYYTLKALLYIKRIKRIEINQSPSKNWHLIIWTSYPYTIREQFRLRRKIGDDLHRLSMDRLRKFGRNTLFYKKEDF